MAHGACYCCSNCKKPQKPQLYSFMKARNPGITALSTDVALVKSLSDKEALKDLLKD